MMKDGEAYEQLAWEQYGSREGENVIEQAPNKVISFDFIRQARMDADMCSNDAKSCYDRIVYSITSIIMQHQNFPASSCICVFTTLQNLHYTVRTIYGDSKSSCGGTLREVPYSGVGQGNGAGPAIWAVVSTPVLKMMKDEGFGFMYKTSIEGKQLHFVGYSFVDDTDIIQSVQPGETFKYWPCACKPLWTHGKADYGLQEEHWSQKSHFGTLFDSAARMDSGPMFQMRTHRM
jgi:hypothetical protein